MNELALFAGAGGGILGGHLLGWRTVCAVEIEPYAAGVLIARQNDGLLPPFPIWDDICTFDGRPWRGIVDVVSGGFPCTDISCAGKAQASTEKPLDSGKRWRELSVKYDHATSSWKTPQCSYRPEGLKAGWSKWYALYSGRYGSATRLFCESGQTSSESSVTLPKWGTMRNGVLSELTTQALPIFENESGSTHPTPTSSMVTIQDMEQAKYHSSKRPAYQDCWPTPMARMTGGATPERLNDKNLNLEKAVAITIFPTPRTTGLDGRSNSRKSAKKRGAWVFPTPTSTNTKANHMRGPENGKPRSPRTHFSTPTVNDAGNSCLPPLADRPGLAGRRPAEDRDRPRWPVEPDVGRVAHGVAARVDRLKAIGNGQVPAVVRLAWSTLTE